MYVFDPIGVIQSAALDSDGAPGTLCGHTELDKSCSGVIGLASCSACSGVIGLSVRDGVSFLKLCRTFLLTY